MEGTGGAAKLKMPAGAKERRAMFEGKRVARAIPPAELLKQGDAGSHPVNSLCGLTSTCEASQFVRSDLPEKAKVIQGSIGSPVKVSDMVIFFNYSGQGCRWLRQPDAITQEGTGKHSGYFYDWILEHCTSQPCRPLTTRGRRSPLWATWQTLRGLVFPLRQWVGAGNSSFSHSEGWEQRRGQYGIGERCLHVTLSKSTAEMILDFE